MIGPGMINQTEESKNDSEYVVRHISAHAEGEKINDRVVELAGNPSVSPSSQLLDTSQVLSQA